jgi:hypothetical protein
MATHFILSHPIWGENRVIAHSAILQKIAANADRPVSEVLQSARILGQNGLYDRPGRGARNPRISLSSLANVTLALAGGGPMAAAETVRQLRPLLPLGTWESWPEPKNKLVGWASGTDYRKRFVDDRPIWRGANLGQFIEELIDLTAAAGAERPWREADPGLVKFFHDGALDIAIADGEPLIALARMFMPKQEGEEFKPLWSCPYFPGGDEDVVSKPHGISRNGVIRFSFIEALAVLWRENSGVDTLPISNSAKSPAVKRSSGAR